ncbi:penicillin-binding protein activator LpoB [Roseomonas populi]|uniref:Penicillin-binding protein activator LpoB n=1 Tax=Roseomonas populi TaxID=3121582 RepID=A0ABT1WYN6_9PROT|nr:penicillin-binding protein activator LpoB [Roseomonas pecuniae]MCR0980962.1 penicillin-binding protein activator LpoB [Roseomonas pecuniae]
MIHSAKAILALAIAASLSACATPEMATQRIDPRNDRSPVGMSLDNRDFEQAAQALVRSMLESDRLQPRPDGQPRVMAISLFTNDTTLRINMNELLQTVRRELSNSGRVVVTTAVGLEGPSDPLAMQARQLRQSGEFNQRTVAGRGQMLAPDISLTGRIIQRTARVDGGAQRVDYNFQLTLTNIRTGIALWEGQEVISRVGSGRTVSW